MDIPVNYTYTYNENSKTYSVMFASDVQCDSQDCAKMLQNLQECEHRTVNLSHSSCVPPFKQILLETPPGKCPLISACVLTTHSAILHVACPHVQGSAGGRTRREGSRKPVGGPSGLLTQ